MSASVLETVVPASMAVMITSQTPLHTSSTNPAQQRPTAPSTAQYGKLLDANGDEFLVPHFTIKDIRSAIPPECFERSAIRSLAYALRDALLITTTFVLAKTSITEELIVSFWIRAILWSVYGFLNGLFATGLWVLAHECGHQAFSPYRTLNDTIGFVIHSALLVPYFPWKISHGKHHKGAGHMHRDMVFVPRMRSEFASSVGKTIGQLSHITEDSPIYALVYIVYTF